MEVQVAATPDDAWCAHPKRIDAAFLQRSAKQLAKDIGRTGVRFSAFLVSEFVARRLSRSDRGACVRSVYMPHVRGRVHYRRHSSDCRVLRQVLAYDEYAHCASLEGVGLVIDCGANIGLGSLCFLRYFPKAHVVAIEPDPENMAVCERNLAGYADRVTFLTAGVWSASVPLKIDRGHDGSREEWALQVRPCQEGEKPDVDAVDIGSVLRRTGHERIGLLKIDIEGSEEEVFARNWRPWLDRTDNLIIEIHSEKAQAVVDRALAGYEHSRETCGEYILYKGIHPKRMP